MIEKDAYNLMDIGINERSLKDRETGVVYGRSK